MKQQRLVTAKAKRFSGALRPPSDKSLTHRAYLFGAIANGRSRVRTPLTGEDCEATLRCLIQLGLAVERPSERELFLQPSEWRQAATVLDCGNSGTTMRLLSGLLASRDLKATLDGDASLRRRPMSRIGEPLKLMGAQFEGDSPPITIRGTSALRGIEYRSPVASAQVKSCVLLAGLRAKGKTVVQEPHPSRDHTERMLRAMGVEVAIESGRVSIEPTTELRAFDFTVPGDISSAAFFLVAATIVPESRVKVRELSVNPTRTGILDVLGACGVTLGIGSSREELGEPVADLELEAPKNLKPFEISGALVPRLIDEIPVLAVLATQCEGVSTIRDARELRVKESDRIDFMAEGLRSMGAQVETFDDGMQISGPTELHGAMIHSRGDHRIAMAFAVAGLVAGGETTIEGAETIATSFPAFEDELRRLASD